MRVLIVAKTRMGKGACIGGITETGKSVRLIPYNADPHDGANREYEVGDVWEITGEPETSLTPPHNENFVVDKKSRIRRTGNTKGLIDTIERMMPPKNGNPRELYEGLLKTTENGSLYVPPGDVIPPYSTLFWRTDKQLTLETEKKNLRYRYPSVSGGCTLTFVGLQKPLKTIPANTLLRLSLAHWWRPNHSPNIEERCYVQLSGWFLEEERQVEPITTPDPNSPPAQTETSSLKVLKNVFGFKQFLPFQEEIIDSIRKGEDTLVVLPTGGGKSLCYQLPACIFNGLTVVVSPLIALMQDQVIQLEQKGIRAAFLNHILEKEEHEEYLATMQKVRNGVIKLLYISPERLVQRPEIHVMLYDSNVACLAIDEAHCISQWGHDFRPNYRELDWVREQFPNAVCIATTATATPRVQEDIKQSLNIPAENQFIDSFNRENLFISIEPRFEILGQTLAYLKKHPNESGIIYCQRRKHVDWLCEQLNTHGISALPYHAGLNPQERTQNQDVFINGNIDVIVATIAFGMGIDKPDVRFVLHAWLPSDLESYYQEIGRSGRDSERAECLLLFNPDDEDTINEFIDDGHPSQREGRIENLQKLIAWVNSKECRRKALLNYFGEQYENEDCGMCDNCCSAKMEKTDLTTPAQKFLSCLHRVNESETNDVFDKAYFFGTLQDKNTSIPVCLPSGILYIIDILRGEKQEEIIENKHHKLSTWGKGMEYSKAQWCYLALQFFQNNLYRRDEEDGSLQLTDKGWKVNTIRITADDRFWGFPVDLVTSVSENSITVELNTYETDSDEQYDYDPVLFDRLRQKRSSIAEEDRTRASNILPRDSLKEMATLLPQSLDEFGQIKGIGKVRMKYADDFLPIIRAYCEEHGVDSTDRETDELNTTESDQEPKGISVENETDISNNSESASQKLNTQTLEILERLRDKRKTVVDKEKVRAFRIFSDKVLKEMAIHLPRTKEALLQIHGIGPVKAEKYADDFLPIIRAYCEEHGIDTVDDVHEPLNTHDTITDKQSIFSQELFELLREMRKTIADEDGVPTFVIFWDRTLKEMATYFPKTKEEFIQIERVNSHKTEKYAHIFLPIIREYCQEHGID
ncbi:hypothetical protein C6497_03270 [Candidatus Poribacteria bacterium]|nr:MAG: hypothetical protein C6497_03270 [Candidatus Poribacteria bacterium]